MTKAIFEYISLTKGKPVWDDEKVKAKTIKIFRAFGHDSKSCIKQSDWINYCLWDNGYISTYKPLIWQENEEAIYNSLPR